MKNKEVKEKALDSIMRDLAPVDSILFAMGTEDTKDQERASLSEYLDSRINHYEEMISLSNSHVGLKVYATSLHELKTIKEKFNL